MFIKLLEKLIATITTINIRKTFFQMSQKNFLIKYSANLKRASEKKGSFAYYKY